MQEPSEDIVALAETDRDTSAIDVPNMRDCHGSAQHGRAACPLRASTGGALFLSLNQ